jgi:hypothetical protein
MERLGVTAGHPFYIEGRGWVRAAELSVGEQGLSAGGTALTMGALGQRAELATVYNLEVEEYHTYFVGRLGAWVHNEYLNGRWIGRGPEPRAVARPSFGGRGPDPAAHAGWGGSYRPPSHFPPSPPPAIHLPDNSIMGPPRTPRPAIGTTRPAPNGGHYVLVHQTRPGYMPTNLVAPVPGATAMASGTPLAPVVWAGQVAGIGLWGAEWYAYLTDGTVWRYVPPPRPNPVIRAAPLRR